MKIGLFKNATFLKANVAWYIQLYQFNNYTIYNSKYLYNSHVDPTNILNKYYLERDGLPFYKLSHR
jgi:hypothetical protein